MVKLVFRLASFYPSGQEGNPWKVNCFPSFNEAVSYAKRWCESLNRYSPSSFKTILRNWNGSSFDYSSCGNIVEIRF
jgi:hypothetical protein